ncbi:aminotransferase class III-fold pyridoxal phosphate-dependent enzyme [Canibacter sp. lx-45]|uniref:aminotransferase class III-fold pyridoxal phosphate-dependent enzyme n=1 Tax=Canibacter zhuwentaonis TaxID=2837491 RepID=UPI001BDDC987|nr:aminotransferase class III-fold pyridoxal phosphate-dependent enzyme [Canibacter zhuwentaonis]MBT1035296.1 aminotransferase class III-fold pyridoxal phosphate-dependent enzyme [Canibacter zhuwentaonis]
MNTNEKITQERRLVTAIPGPKSIALQQRRSEVVSTGIATALPVFIERAHGAILVDVDGNQIIDCGSGIGVTTVGHTDARVVDAATAQLKAVTHTLMAVTPYESYVAVAEQLAKHAPINGQVKSILVNSGAEAVENAVKISRKYTGRSGVAVLNCAYHGRTQLTSTMNHKAAPYAAGFGPRAADVFRAPNSFPLHDGLSGEAAAARTIDHLEKTVSAGDLACLVAEPIQGEGGFVVPADGYLAALAKWCKENSIVFIADEVQSGIARTGTVYATEHFGFEPDLILSAKGIAGGLPLAAVTGRAEIMDCTGPGTLGGTFGGNPVSCAAAKAVFELIAEGTPQQNAQRVERVLGGGLRKLQEKHPAIAEVRGKGAMLAIEITKPGTLNPDKELVDKIIAHACKNGVLLLNAGLNYNVLRFLPPVKISDELIADVLAVIDEAFTAAASN